MYRRYLFLITVLACLGGCLLPVSGQGFGSDAMRKLQIAEYAIANLYVDSVDEHKLVEAGIVSMLKQLDPHSTYVNAEEVKKMNEPLQGNFEGIGVQFQMMEDTLMVVQPVSDGPSEKAGILAGDRIVAVNDTAIAGVQMQTDEIMRRLRGPKGSVVVLRVIRRGVADPLVFRIRRDKIPIYSIDASYLIRKGIGYIRINRFGATTAEEFSKALAQLQRQGMKDLILDLQGNGGGYLKAAIDLANEFLQAGELIVYTQGRVDRRNDFVARGNGHMRSGRLVVLIDEFTASASEIVSGAIQDWDRGVIVGRRSFGKGLVQRPVDLPDGSMIRLTIARYYTPAGRCIQRPYKSAVDDELADASKGAQGNVDAYNHDLIDRYNRGEMTSADSIHFPDSLKCFTQKLHRTVYGGGGIMPDYFVPVDTTRYTAYHRNLVAKGLVLKTSAAYADRHRQDLKRTYRSFEKFESGFTVPDELLQQLRQAADEAGIAFDEAQYRQSLPLLQVQLKALVARDLWTITEYFRVMNMVNESVAKAVGLLENGDYDQILAGE